MNIDERHIAVILLGVAILFLVFRVPGIDIASVMDKLIIALGSLVGGSAIGYAVGKNSKEGN